MWCIYLCPGCQLPCANHFLSAKVILVFVFVLSCSLVAWTLTSAHEPLISLGSPEFMVPWGFTFLLWDDVGHLPWCSPGSGGSQPYCVPFDCTSSAVVEQLQVISYHQKVYGKKLKSCLGEWGVVKIQNFWPLLEDYDAVPLGGSQKYVFSFLNSEPDLKVLWN